MATSTAVKKRYIAKTYTRWSCDLRNEDFERIEKQRGEMSRAGFLKFLCGKYAQDTEAIKPEADPE